MPKYPQATPTSGTPNANGPGPATIPRPPKLPETIVTDDPLKRKCRGLLDAATVRPDAGVAAGRA